MKRYTRCLLIALSIILGFVIFIIPAFADEGAGNSSAYPLLSYKAAESCQHSAEVSTQSINGNVYLFLPSSADLNALTLSFYGQSCLLKVNEKTLELQAGEPFNFASLYDEVPEDGKYYASFVISGYEYRVIIMCSASIRSLYITSSDANKGHNYIDAVKGNKAKGNGMVMLDSDGSCIYCGVMKEIKGRGNSTWYYPKKPYQFKLDEKVDLLGAGDSEASKTWILLANYIDDSLFRNALTNDLAAAIGLNYSHNCEFVDLYYDGVYCGNYLLSEKTEIDSARIDIRDLEGEIEDVNGDDADFDSFNENIINNKYNNPMQVIEGVKLPEDYSGGYLLELDYSDRAQAEKCWFKTGRGQYVVCKSPEYLPSEAMEYVSGIYQNFEDAVFNGGIHPNSGKSYTEYVDLDSLAKSYLLLTLSQNGDAFLSSTYFYIPEDVPILFAGPVWDFDSAYGLFVGDNTHGYLHSRSQLTSKLFQIKSFREAVDRQWDLLLKDIVRETVLNSSDQYSSAGVNSIGKYGEECFKSRQMDAVRWKHDGSYSSSVEAMRTYIRDVYNWVDNVLTNPTAYAAIIYDDVHLNSWYLDAVSYTADKGYFRGTSDVSFTPGAYMSRYMLVTVLYRMAGKPPVSGECSYTDIPSGAEYTDAVIWADNNGITNGYGDGRFGPYDVLTREQMAVFFYRFAQLSGKTMEENEIPDSFCDKASVSDWAQEAFGWAIGEGVINGVSTEMPTLAPKNFITRAMAATMIYRYDEGLNSPD